MLSHDGLVLRVVGRVEGIGVWGKEPPLVGERWGGDAGEAVEVQNDEGDWIPWREVESFAGSGPADRDYALDAVSGEVQFGPTIRQPNGAERAYGAVPAKGAPIRVGRYRFGGGITGNVGANTLTVLKSSIPSVAGLTNPTPATGRVAT